MTEGKPKTEQYVHQSYTEYNPLTGLSYNRAFFSKADDFLKTSDAGCYLIVALDIEHFKIFNKLYGREKGDALLIHIADCLRQIQDEYHTIAGYLGGDNFCIVMPDDLTKLQALEQKILLYLDKNANTIGFYPVFGLCPCTESISAITMYDHATTALSQTEGKFANRICRYNPLIENNIEKEILLLSEVQTAMENDEFTFFAQPQCDIHTRKIVGAESLVRWIHPEKGLISPGIFVPVLEKNGLIAMLDRLVWRKVCEWLRSWIDRGYHPVPISINISRIDIFSMNVPAYLKELLDTYQIPANLIKTEITESAYAENNDAISQVVKELRDLGFLVMMDDFGSGYSSLNMLKDIAVDVLKLDMRFLDISGQEENKGITILESVVNLTKTMGLPFIAEGVETQEQENFLSSMGCRYSQGYFYYKPLPLNQFEELLSDERRLDFSGLHSSQMGNLHVREFLDDKLFNDTTINNMLGATAFYDFYENQITITRVNEQYYQLTGISDEEQDEYTRLGNHVRSDDYPILISLFQQAYLNPNEGARGNIHFLRSDGEVILVHIRIFFLQEREGHRIYFGSLMDLSSIKEKKKGAVMPEVQIDELTSIQKSHMEKYYGDLPYGFAVARLLLDATGQPADYDIIYVNHEMSDTYGTNIGWLRQLVSETFSMQYEELFMKAYQVAYMGKTETLDAYSSVSNRYFQLLLYQYEYGYVGCIITDATHAHIYEDSFKSIMYAYREVYFLNLQDNYYRMVYPDEYNILERGSYEEAINRHFRTGRILRHDEQRIRQFLALSNVRSELATKDSIEYRYQRRNSQGEEEWCLTSITISDREGGVPKTALITIRSIEDLIQEEEQHRQQNMVKSLANMSDGFFVYSALEEMRILYANPRVLQIFGCNSIHEFRALVGNSFRGMVHPDDWNRIDWEIENQIRSTDDKMDHVQYRIIRKDGEVRWIDDYGHLDNSGTGLDDKLYYVFISDVTDTMTLTQKERLLTINKHYV